ncbi:fimbrial protein [Pseudomonas sp. M30-35]|uniref:fimbrial protein n=1 Tax=Pseudomonas sp. M30-35 TaxID=1981174 RepID=UPI000B3C64B4|nr:fimbrial protein [Pseudomonas sp. M30-35]ARU88549.1 hypothetical protein B9K09_11505 [Pseudomonas sp. M30-35]
MQRHRNVFFMAIGLVLSLTLLPTKPALAGNTDNCSSPQLPWSTALDTEVTANLPEGEVIPGSDASLVINITCTAAWDDNQAFCTGGGGWNIHPSSLTGMETSVPGVYTFSGMPSGIGYQFLDAGGSPIPLGATGRHDTGVQIKTGEQTVLLRFRMVRIFGDLSSGSFNIPMVMGCVGTEFANINESNSTVSLMVNATVITQTCSMTTPDTQVQLPKVARSAFNGVGSSAGSTPFTLDFQCDADADARFHISDITDLGNSSDALKLLESSSASGLGVRLLHQGNPVRLAPSQIFDQGGSEFPLRNLETSQSLISLPFSAEYVQTVVPVVAGSVQAQAIVTIDYN